MIRHILVAVDGSEGARRAVDLARERAGALRARITLLHVVEPPVSFPLDAYGLTRTQVYEGQLSRARALVAALAQELPGEVAQVIDSGAPAESICAQAEERGADLVIVGSRGSGPIGRWLLGSVSDRVVHLSRKPVVVAR